MVSTHSGFEKPKNRNSFEKLHENLEFKAEEISWLLDNLPVTVFRSSNKLSWGMEYISTNVEQLTGYLKTDFIEQKLMWSDIIFPEDTAIIDKAVEAAKKNKDSYQVEYRIKKADGSTAFIQEKAHIVLDDSGKLIHKSGVFFDLTSEAKRMEDPQGSVKADERIQFEMLQSFVGSLSRGEIPELITDNYSKDINEIKNNINNCIQGLQGLVECDKVLQRMAVNDHTKGVEGNYVGIFASTGEATNQVRERLLSITSVVNDIAVGNTSQLEKFKKIHRRSEQDILVPALIQALENINLLIEDTGMLAKAGVEGKYETRADVSKHYGEYKKIVQGFNDTLDDVIIPLNAAIEDSLMLSKAAVEGKLDVRADITRHKGNFRKIIGGFNDTLDAVIGPLNVAAEYVERISRGEIPERITDNYNGDFNEIKNNLNNCMDGLQGLVECNHILQRMAVNDQTKGVEGEYVGIYASMAEATNLVRARVLNVTNVLENIAVGNTSRLPELTNIGRRSEQDRLMPAIIMAMENIHLLIEDTEMLARAGIEGKLDIRADASKHKGEYRTIVQGINDTLDAVIGPLNVAAEYVERISRGEIPQRITDNYNGDFNEIKNNLNTCIDGLQGLVECNNILQRMAVNDQRKGVEGEYIGIYASMAEATNLVRARVLNVTKQLNNIAVGDSSELEGLKKIGRRSEQDQLLPAIIRAMENVQLLIQDTEMLSKAAVEGKLDIRADASKHQGEYRTIVQGINDTLDAVIGPLNVAAEYVERIGRGEMPERITDNYNGDFNEIKNNLNNCIEGLQGLVECNHILQRMAVNDQTKGVEGEYVGIYASIAEATNLVRARVLNVTNVLENIAVGNTSRLSELKDIGGRSEQDRLMPAIIAAMENVNLLIEDTEMLARAGVEGKLDIRADASRHQGEYGKVIQGINDTLDAVISPLNVAAEYVERISRGDIPEPITDNYNGDFNEIKNNINICIESINNLIEDSIMLSEAGTAGHLDTRAEIIRHEGDFRRIISGFNDTLDAVIGPLNVAAEYVERISRGEIPERITDNYNGDFNEIKNNLNNCIDGLQGLVECNNVLQLMAINDHTKCVEGEYVGIYASMGKSTNEIRDRLLLVTDLVNNISVGDISKLAELEKIRSRSEHDRLRPAFIKAMKNIKLLIEDIELLSRTAVEGKLDTRADASRHQGEYRTVVRGINDTLDAVIGPLNVAAEYVERISRGDIPEPITDNYNGDFNEIKNNLNVCISAINSLVEDSLMLSKAGIAGQLDIRADATRHEGDFRKIIEGVNDTLDAVIGPLNVAAEYVERISRGDIPELITDNYNGDFNEIKNNLNTCISAVNYLVGDSLMLSEASVLGKLDIRADATRHEGDFRKIITGVNNTLDAVIGPLNEAIRVSNEFSDGNFRARVDENLQVKGDFVNFKNVLNNIGISVSEIIKSAQSVTMQVAEHSDEASRGAAEVGTAAENVAISSQKSSELTRELLYKIEGINREIVDLSVSNEKIADSSKGILSAANEVVRIGKDAQALGRDTNIKMENVEKIARESVVGITSLTEQIKQIDGIVQLINDITSQINLLSLNAAIEAARAGEHGRGFAVVAGEVKNLATKARNATDTIESVVSSVQRDSKKTADAINTANNEIIDGVSSVNKTLEALNTIIKNATQVTTDIGYIAKAIDDQANISIKVVKASEEGNVMTQEVQREAEGLAAISEETSASVQEIGAAIHEVTNLADKLKSELEAYSV